MVFNKQQVLLVLNGIDTIADVVVNGRKIAEVDNYHRWVTTAVQMAVKSHPHLCPLPHSTQRGIVLFKRQRLLPPCHVHTPVQTCGTVCGWGWLRVGSLQLANAAWFHTQLCTPTSLHDVFAGSGGSQ